ncbi:MAG: O-antigen ligase family protein [Candidatus Hydrogenedentes bacterium]|nr:O-antigen ligase family protein [Candidatus Hydrogenedentota bacterium]
MNTELAQRAEPAAPNDWSQWLTPRMTLSAVALLLVALGLFGSVAAGPLLLVAAVLGIVIIALLGFYAEAVLLAVLLVRPVLVTIPELNIAGHEIGIDGMVNWLVLAGFVLVAPVGRRAPWRLPVMWIALLFLAVMLFSLRLSTDPLFGLRQWMRFLSYFVFMAVAFHAAQEEHFVHRFRHVVAGVVVIMLAMGALQLLLLLREFSFRQYIALMFEGDLQNRLDGFQDYPHIYGTALLVCVPVMLWSAWHAVSARARYTYYALFAVASVAILYTGVRTILGALIVTVVMSFIGARKYGTLAVVGVLFVIAGFGSGVFQARLSAFTDPSRATEWNSLVDRREIWNVVDLGIAQHPIRGYGLGSIYQYVADSPLRHSSKLLTAHCDYRKFAFEGGIFAGVLFALLYLSVVLRAWFNRTHDLKTRTLNCCVAGLIAGIMVMSLVEEVFQDFLSMTLLWSLVGVALGMREVARARERAGRSAVV